MKQKFGSISYDVPVHMRKQYSRLRALFKGQAIMQTASSYLFPWGLAQKIEEGLQRINSDEDGFPRPQRDQIAYCIFKYDEEVSGAALLKSAEDALRRQMRRMKSQINDKMMKLFAEEGESEHNLKSAKVTCRRASSTLQDLRKLALVFDLTNNMDAGFLAYEAFIEHKKEEIKDWEEAAKAVEEDEEDALNKSFTVPKDDTVTV